MDSAIRSHLIAESTRQWARSIREAHALTTKNGGQFYAFLQPHLCSRGSTNELVATECTQRALGIALGSGYSEIRQAVSELRSEGINVVDLSTALDSLDSRTTYLDFVHVEDSSNAAIAEAIMESIDPDSKVR